MLGRNDFSRFQDWCSEQGGEYEVDGGEDHESIKRCVLDSEGGPWNQRSESFDINNIAVVEIRGDHTFYAEDTTGETLEITEEEWVNVMDTEMEDEVDDNPEEDDYEENKTRRTGSHGGSLQMSAFGDDLTFTETAQNPDGPGTWMRRVKIDVLKSWRDVDRQVITQEEMWEEARWDAWDQWTTGGEQFPEDLIIPGKDKEKWLKQNNLWEEYQNYTDQGSPEPEHDEFPCPDGDFIEVEDSVELEGEIDRITCNDEVTRVDFTTEDGEAWSVEGSPEGWDPIELKQSGRTVDELDLWDLEFLGSSGRVSGRR
jgi:hypothetical protein